MGKKNFKEIYQKAVEHNGSDSCKISYFSDTYNKDSNFAGMIVYSIDGKYSWRNNAGLAKGFNGRSFYVVIQCTDEWPDEQKKDAGQGRVHDYLIKNTFGFEFQQAVVCCGGFAILKGEKKYSSVWLNKRHQKNGESDDSHYLSQYEEQLVSCCIDIWKEKGKHHIFQFPENVSQHLKK